MTVSLETLSELERKLTISLADSEIQDEVNTRLKNLAPKVQIPGFRQGKVPVDVIRKRFSDKVRLEVIDELMKNALEKAIEGQNLKLTSYPKINLTSSPDKGDFSFEATVEVFPEVSIKELENDQIDLIEAQVDEADVEDMIKKLLEQHKVWKDVERASQNADQLVIDFKGFVDNVPFAGGEATNFKVVLGEKRMIPDFEKGLLKRKAGQEFDMEVKFPEDYGQADLAGKEAKFEIKVHQVQEGDMPELTDEFAAKFNIEGGVEALKKDIKENMHRELKKQVSQINRKNVFDKLIEANTVTLPQGLIDREIEELKHQMFHQVFGTKHHDNEVIPDFPRELFLEQAKRRVHLSLLYVEYVKKHSLNVDSKRLDTMIEEMVSAFENPSEAKEWYKTDESRLDDLRGLIMEETVMEKILEFAKPSLKKLNYRETMEIINSKNDGEA